MGVESYSSSYWKQRGTPRFYRYVKAAATDERGSTAVADGQARLRKGQEIRTWTLRRRDQKSWELLLPPDAIYMPRDSAVRVLAHRLALLADAEDSSANLKEKAQLAETLNTILMKYDG